MKTLGKNISRLILLMLSFNLGINFYSAAMEFTSESTPKKECPTLVGLALKKVIQNVSEGKMEKEEVLKVLPEQLREPFNKLLSLENEIKRLKELNNTTEKNNKEAERDITLKSFYTQIPKKVNSYLNSIFYYFLSEPKITENGIIIKAIEDNDKDTLKFLFKELKFNPNRLLTDKEMSIPLFIFFGAAPTTENLKFTPLELAAALGRVHIVQLLLDVEANLKWNTNPLIFAISSLPNKVGIPFDDLSSPLEETIYKKFNLHKDNIFETIEILLKEAKKKNIDLINLQDANGYTPLMWATARSPEAAIYLLEQQNIDLKTIPQALELANNMKHSLETFGLKAFLPDREKRISNLDKTIEYLNEEVQKQEQKKA